MPRPALRPPRRLPLHALAFVAALSAAPLSGCSMLDATLEARTVCFTVTDYPITGVPVSGDLSLDIDYDLGSDLPVVSEKGVSYSLVLTHMDLSAGAASPPVDLGGVDLLDVSIVAPAGAGLPDAVLAHYLKGSDPHPVVLSAASSSDRNLAPYVTDGKVTFHTDAGGDLPTSDWTADVRGCFLLTVTVNYGGQP
jgi:hypothetical protein